MKKIWLSSAVMGAMGMASCGPNREEVKEEDVVPAGPTLCECINMTMKEQTPECEAMEKEWEAKYEAASDEVKSAMKAEFEACKSAPEEEGAAH